MEAGVVRRHLGGEEAPRAVARLAAGVEAEPGVTGYMVEKCLKEALGFSPKGDVFAPGTLPRQEGKAKRVFTANDPMAVK